MPDLDILTLLAAELGITLPAASAGDVFLEIGHQAGAFAGMTYETLGDSGEPLK